MATVGFAGNSFLRFISELLNVSRLAGGLAAPVQSTAVVTNKCHGCKTRPVAASFPGGRATASSPPPPPPPPPLRRVRRKCHREPVRLTAHGGGRGFLHGGHVTRGVLSRGVPTCGRLDVREGRREKVSCSRSIRDVTEGGQKKNPNPTLGVFSYQQPHNYCF